MLTCMRVRRQLWLQVRRSGQQQARTDVLSPQGLQLPLSFVEGKTNGAGLGLGLGVVRGYASENGEQPSLPKESTGVVGDRYGNGVWWIGTGAGTIALLGVLAVSSDVLQAAPDAKAHAETGFSAVWSSGAGIGRELMKMAGSVKDASVRSFVDLVEAVACIWVLARCISSILSSAVDNASSDVASWWRPRVASFLAGESSHHSSTIKTNPILFQLL